MKAYKCTTCGASMNFDENDITATCEFCGTVHTLSQQEFVQDVDNNMPVMCVEKTLTVDDCVKNFIKKLGEQPYVIKSALSNINIKSIYENHHIFVVNTADFEGNFNGTACYDRQESYVDYESKTVKVGNNYETVKEPVTRYRTVTDRSAASGNFSATSFCAVAFSRPLINYLEIEQDLAQEEGKERKFSSGARVLERFEEQLVDFLFTDSNASRLTDETGAIYGDANELNVDDFVKKRFAEIVETSYDDACWEAAKLACPGQYCEDINETHCIINQESFSYLVPVCTIVYECAGHTFYSVQVMSNRRQIIVMSYPEDISLLNREIEYATQEVKSVTEKLKIINSNPAGTIALVIILVFTAYIMENFIFWLIAIGVSGFLIWGLVDKYKKKKEAINNMDKITADLRRENADTQDVMRRSYEIFLKEYDKTHDANNALKAVSNAYSSLSVDNSKLGYRYSNEEVNQSIIDSLNNSYEDTKNVKGKIFLTVGKRFFDSNGLKIYLDGEEKYELAGNDRVEIPVHKDGQLVIKEKDSKEFEETLNVSANEVTVVKVDYGMFGLKVRSESKEMSESNYKAELEFEEECLKKFGIEAEKNSLSGKAKRFIKDNSSNNQ